MRGGDRGGYSVHATHSKQSTEESKWSDNGELITLVHRQEVQTPLEGKGGEGPEGEGGARRGGEGRGKEKKRLLLADVMLSTNSLTGTISPACGVVWRRSSLTCW